MPGILGIVRFHGAPVSHDLLGAIAAVSAHRGTRYSCVTDGPAAFAAQNDFEPGTGVRREAAIYHDRRSGLGAVTDASFDEQLELARALGSDASGWTNAAELVARAYRRWGRRCLDHLTGDFAVAIWERQHRSVFCARDPFGARGLYWRWEKGCFCFASEMQQILAMCAADPGIDELALADTLLRRCHQDHQRTVLRGVQRLPHGHYLITNSNGPTASRYWDPSNCDDLVYEDDRDYVEHFAEVYSRAVEDRVSERREDTGLLMSGGLDSCSIAATGRPLLHKGGDRLRVGSVVFDEHPECDERQYILAMEQHLRLEVDYIKGDHFPWFEPLTRQMAPIELPIHPWQPYFHHVFSRFREQGVRTVLTGIGGDTLMTGSLLVYLDGLLSRKLSALGELYSSAKRRDIPVHRLFYRSIVNPLIPGHLRKAVRRLRVIRGKHLPPWISPGFAERSNIAGRLYPRPLMNRDAALARQAIMHEISDPGLEAGLRAIDYYAATQGCRVRHPFLDRRLAEFILAIPPQQLLAGSLTKDLLRRAMEDRLPAVVADRADKTYLTSFMHFNFKRTLREDILSLLHGSRLHEMGIIDANVLRRVYDEYCHGRIPLDASDLWAVLSLERWCRAYDTAIDEHRRVSYVTYEPIPADVFCEYKTA